MKIASPKSYFDGEVSPGFVSLYTGKTIVMISTGLLGLFLPIFLYDLFGKNLKHVAFYFLVGHALYILTLFFCARFLNNFGFRRALRTSVFFGAFYYLILYFINETNLYYLIPMLIFILTLFRLTHWVPYHVDFAKFTDKKNRGRQFSAIMATSFVIGIFAPVTAGFVISKFGFDALFVTAIILYLASGVAYLTLPHTKEQFSWNYSQTLKNLFLKKHRRDLLAFAASGAEQSAVLVVWPIFIYQLLNGNYLKVGIVSTFIIAATVIIQLTLGKNLDKTFSKEKFLKFGSIFNSIGWIIKIFIETSFQVFVIGAFHSVVRIFARTPFETLSYDIMADQAHFVDEFTVLREIAINTGRVISFGLVALFALVLPLQFMFIIAAVASVFFNFLRPFPEQRP